MGSLPRNGAKKCVASDLAVVIRHHRSRDYEFKSARACARRSRTSDSKGMR